MRTSVRSASRATRGGRSLFPDNPEELLPVAVDVPRSALCAFGIEGMRGHRVKLLYASVPSRRRQICALCKYDIVHDPWLGTYVIPFTIEEEPF